jgi:hypothetical protein
MNITKILIACITLLLCGSGTLYAQQGPVSAGGEGTGGGGSFSCSVGQLDYITLGISGFLHEGLQQPFELYTNSVIEVEAPGFNAFVFPNPANGEVTLSVENATLTGIQFTLFNTQGQIMVSGPLTGALTPIDLSSMPAGVYFIKVGTGHQATRLFKIIKL